MRRELVILGQDDVQAPCLSHRGMKLDVGATASHVGSNGDPARLPCAGDDFGLLAVLSRIEDDRLQPCLEQQLADVFRSVDRACPDQHGAGPVASPH